MLTLKSLHAQPGFMEAHPGALEVYLGAVEPHPGALEAQPGTLGADPGSMEAYYKTQKISDLLRTPVSYMWTYSTVPPFYHVKSNLSQPKK
jgi:hypothetical protein